MAGFTGKWTLKDVTGADAYFEAIYSPDEHRAKLRQLAELIKSNSSAYIEELTVDPIAKTVHRVVSVNGERRKDFGVLSTGVEFELPSADGRPAKISVQLNSETKLTRIEAGDGFRTETVLELYGSLFN